MRKAQLLLSALLLGSLLVACAPKVASAPTPQAPISAPAAVPVTAKAAVPARPAWQVKWDAMVEGAEKEGKVVIYSSSVAETRAAFQRAFGDRFGIKAEFIAGMSGELATKILAERRAGLRLGDASVGVGSQVLLRLKPAGLAEPIEVGDVLILPEFSDPKSWLGGGFRWQDAEHMSLTYTKYEQKVVSRNTELVKEGEIQSYNDLLSPKWKGKIIMFDPTLAGVSLMSAQMVGHYIMGWDYMRALAKQEPLIVNNARIQAEWLARGKYAVGFGAKVDALYEFKKMGLPVELINMREGGFLVSGSGTLTLLKDAAHPNAARLFVNWVLTKEAQTIFTRTGGYPSIRLDVSDEGALYPRAAPDTKAPAGDTEEAILKQPDDLRIIKEIFGHLLGK